VAAAPLWVPTFSEEVTDMAKRVSMFGFLAIALLIFFIWTNPHGTASTVGDFFGSVAHVAGQAWHKLGDFVKDLAGHKS
jgi:hypothetical protein